MSKTAWILGVLFFVAFGAGFYFHGFTGNVIMGDKEDSFFKTLCNQDTRQCLEVYVECEANSLKITPVTPYAAVDLTKFNSTNEIRC